jgi:hypothetical protein
LAEIILRASHDHMGAPRFLFVDSFFVDAFFVEAFFVEAFFVEALFDRPFYI